MENKISVGNGRLVDIFVVDKNLRDKVLENYPWLESKFNEDTSDRQQIVYGFLKLNREEYDSVKSLLRENKERYEYEVRDSETGRFIELNSFSIGFFNFGSEFYNLGYN